MHQISEVSAGHTPDQLTGRRDGGRKTHTLTAPGQSLPDCPLHYLAEVMDSWSGRAIYPCANHGEACASDSFGY